MTTLHYIKASDVEQDFCFLEVSRSKNEAPFMDIRISDDRKMSFVTYSGQQEISFSPEEWLEIQEKATSFYRAELENEDSFDNWGTSL
ncbi:MAG: hypothetical protein JKX81_20070 [Arenicella sp.]|nr:hypothetical protein [Arenicella sp.]